MRDKPNIKRLIGKALGPALMLTQESPGGFQIGGSVTTGDDGVPRRRFVKDLVHVGTHEKARTGEIYEIDESRLEHWRDTADRYLEAGNTIPLIDANGGHDGWESASAQRGELIDTFVEDGRLYGVIEAIGNDAIEACARSYVSIFAPESWRDSKGNEYTSPIRHVALTGDPVNIDQGKFLPIAASNAGIIDRSNGADVLRPVLLSSNDGDLNMDFSALAKRLGIDEDMNEDNAVDLIGSAFDALTTHKDEAVSAVEAAHAAQTITLSQQERGSATDLIETRLDSITGSAITPAVAKHLKPLLTCSDVMLAYGDDGSKPQAIQMIDALAGNDPNEFPGKARTTSGRLALAQPGEDTNHDELQATRARMAAAGSSRPNNTKKAG